MPEYPADQGKRSEPRLRPMISFMIRSGSMAVVGGLQRTVARQDVTG